MHAKIFIVLVVFPLALGQTGVPGSEAVILKFENNLDVNGEYDFSFESSDGITREETGRMEKSADGKQLLVVKGSYSYIGDNGVLYKVDYIADENGYQVVKEDAPPRTPPSPAPLGPRVGG